MKSGEIEGNVYFAAGNSAADADVKELKNKSHEHAGIFADPRFDDWERGVFTLRSDSPALGLGIKPVDLTGVGVRR